MIDTIKVAISAVIGGVVTGVFGVWLQRVKNQSSNESVYANHTQDLFERLDKITSERDDLKNQVIELQGQVKTLNAQIKTLNTKFDEFNKIERTNEHEQ